jgi:hypothetical protein
VERRPRGSRANCDLDKVLFLGKDLGCGDNYGKDS